MVTFDGGAFPGFGEYGKFRTLGGSDFFVPYQDTWQTVIDPTTTPQNKILQPETVFETVANMDGIKKYYAGKGTDPVVVAFNHYARGAKWLTWHGIWPFNGESETLDSSSWLQLKVILKGNIKKLTVVEIQHLSHLSQSGICPALIMKLI